MAKKSVVERAARRVRTVRRYAVRRAELKAILGDPSVSRAEKDSARIRLQKLPRNASPVRLRNRCPLTGRPRGYYRKFGLGRNKLREAAMRGDIPGLVKSSW